MSVSTENAKAQQLMLGNKLYDFLKNLATFIIPPLAVLYSALAATWELPYGFEVASTALAVETFLAAVLGISKSSYNKTPAVRGGGAFDGALIVEEGEERDTVSIEINEDPVDYADGTTFALQLKKHPGV